MNSLFTTGGPAWLASMLKTHASVTITYWRGADSVVISAFPDSTLLRREDPETGVPVVERTDRDWVITAADLVLAGELAEPKKGDMTTFAVGGTVETYAVLPYGDEPLWQWEDPHRTVMRIHTKRRRVEDAA